MATIPATKLATQTVAFYSHRPEKYGEVEAYRHCFSNFSPHPVVYEGKKYQTSEHAFQAAKMEKEEDRDAVAACGSAMDAAKLGRSRKMRSDWEQVKISIMETIVENKFRQNPECSDALKKTGGAYIEERTKNDSTWGSGSDEEGGTGKNMLGKVLMNVRQRMFGIPVVVIPIAK